MSFRYYKTLKKEKNHKKIITKIALYLGIGASIATIIQVAKDVFIANKPNISTTNNAEGNTITQIQLGDGNVYVDNTSNTRIENDTNQQKKLEVSSSQFVAYSYDLIRQGNSELAIEEIQQYIHEENLDPMNAAILNYNLGVAYYNLGKYGMATEALETSVNTAAFADAYYLLGIIRSESFEEYTKAILDFTTALEYEIKPEYLLARAGTYEKSNQLEAASEDYYAVLLIDPQNEWAIAGIERIEKR